MGRIVAKQTEPDNVCRGGNSFGCRREEHPKSQKHADIYCFRCGDRMGCYLCVQIARELVCLRCNDWATKIALKVHGPVVGSFEMRREKLNKAIELAKADMPLIAKAFEPDAEGWETISRHEREPGEDDGDE